MSDIYMHPEPVAQVVPDLDAVLPDTSVLLEEETYTCPIHGDLGGIDECPLC